MIYLSNGNSHSRNRIMYITKQSFKEYIKQKNTIRHLYRITIKLLEYAYVSSYVSYTYLILFTNPIINIQEKKTSNMHTSFSYHIHIHRNFWFCEYVYHP